jgi:hypothetical protein
MKEKKELLTEKVNAQYPYHKKNREKIKEIKLVKIVKRI